MYVLAPMLDPGYPLLGELSANQLALVMYLSFVHLGHE